MDLEPFRFRQRRPQTRGDIRRQMITAKRQYRRMHHRTVVKNDNVGGPATDIDQRDADFTLLREERGVGRSQRLEHQFRRGDRRALAALRQILPVALRRGDDMNPRLEPHARHPERIAHTLLVVDRVLLRQNMQHLPIERNRDGPRRVDYPLDVALTDLAPAHRHDTVAVEAPDVRAGDADHRRADPHAGAALRFGTGGPNRIDRRLDIDHHALAQPAAWGDAVTNHGERTVSRLLRDQRANLAGADVDSAQRVLHRLAVTSGPGLRRPCSAGVGARAAVRRAAGRSRTTACPGTVMSSATSRSR